MLERMFKPLPDERQGFRKNELPICRTDIAEIADTLGEQVAENARFVTQCIRREGGVNPMAVDFVFPEGREGPIDHQALLTVIANYAIWSKLSS